MDHAQRVVSSKTPSGRSRTISNPVIGDVVTFVEATEEGGGHRIILEIELAAGGGNVMHVHLSQTESFKVLQGQLNVVVAGKSLTLAEGEEATVEPRTPHRFFALADVGVRFQVTVLNPGRLEDGLRVLYGLSRDGQAPNGIPRNPLVLALGSQTCDMYVAALPLWFQIGLFRPLAALARRLGYERKLNRYLTA
jgi:mannose-6-phosphate isomerase-like protein (cupin superfamily)